MLGVALRGDSKPSGLRNWTVPRVWDDTVSTNATDYATCDKSDDSVLQRATTQASKRRSAFEMKAWGQNLNFKRKTGYAIHSVKNIFMRQPAPLGGPPTGMVLEWFSDECRFRVQRLRKASRIFGPLTRVPVRVERGLRLLSWKTCSARIEPAKMPS